MVLLIAKIVALRSSGLVMVLALLDLGCAVCYVQLAYGAAKDRRRDAIFRNLLGRSASFFDPLTIAPAAWQADRPGRSCAQASLPRRSTMNAMGSNNRTNTNERTKRQ